jgi:uncharacterized protein (DUF2336 family)
MEGHSYLEELDNAISLGTRETRLQALWHATDLLITGQFSDEQVWTFGEVIQRLAEEIEVAARGRLAERLARFDRAPANIVRQLASDNAIEVAGPMLQHSKCMSSESLVESARIKSQDHLLAISKRASLPSEVTDVLVVRGNAQVANTVARNSGAAFSNSGFLHLLKRSENDSILAESLGSRGDIPRHVFQQLIAKASHEVRRKLQQERPDLAEQVKVVVTDVTGTLHLKFGPASKDYFIAKRLVGIIYKQGQLTEAKMLEYGQARKFDEAVVGLSLLCELPVNIAERALTDVTGDLLLVLTKAAGFSWETALALLFLAARDHRVSSQALEGKRRDFERLAPESALAVIRFYQSRKDLALLDA